MPARDVQRVARARGRGEGPWPCSYPRAERSTHARGEQAVRAVGLSEAGVAGLAALELAERVQPVALHESVSVSK